MALPDVNVKVTADTTQATAGLNNLGKDLKQVEKGATGATTGAKKLSRGFRNLSNVSGQTRARIQNTSFQLQDIAVQMQMGTRTSTVLAQQLPQLAGGFGAVGAVVGVLAGVGIPALAFAFSSMVDDIKDFDDALSEAEETTDQYFKLLGEVSGIGKDSFSELEEQIRGASQATRDLFAISKIEVLDSIDALNDSLVDSVLSASYLKTAIEDVGSLIDASFGEIVAANMGGSLGDEVNNLRYALVKLKDSNSLEGQLSAALEMRDIFKENVDVTGEMTDQQLEFWKALSQTIQRMEILAGTTEETLRPAIDLTDEIEAGAAMMTGLVNAAALAADPISEAATAAFNLAKNLGEAAMAQASIVAIASQREGGGRGTVVPNAMDTLMAGLGGEWVGSMPGDDTETGGGFSNDSQGRLESLIEDLQTEREIVEQFRQEGLELLANASAAELEALGGFNEAKLRLEQEYQERLKGIKKQGAAADLAMTLGAGATILGALGAFNEKAFKMAQVAGAAQALISTYQGSAEALKLPFPQNLAAAAAVTAKGLALVGAIKGVSSSGAGGGAGGGVAGGGVASASPQTPLDVRLSGLSADDMISGANMETLFDRLQDTAGDRGLRVSFA